MAAKKKSKQPSEPFLAPPEVKSVPQEFNGAAALNLEAKHAIQYWKEQRYTALFSDRKIFANEKLRAWEQVSKAAQEIMQSHQMKLF